MALRDNLVSWWELNETSGVRVDAHAGNDLTDNNTVLSSTGKQGNCADMERSNTESLSITDASQVNLEFNGDFSISMWVNLETLNSTWSSLISKWNAGTNRGPFAVIYSSSGFRFYTSETGADYPSVLFTPTISTATWYHIVFTYDESAGSANMYINSVAEGAQTGLATTIWEAGTAPVTLGGGNEHTATTFDGLMDEVGIWNRVLTGSEITEIYNSGAGLAYADTAAGDVTINPATQVATFAIPTYSVSAAENVSVSPAALVATFAIPTYSVSVQEQVTVNPAAQVATFTIPPYSVLAGDALINVSAQVATFSVPAYTVSSEEQVIVTPATQVATLTIPTYTVTAEKSVIVSVAVQVLTFSLPTLQKVGGVWRKIARATNATWARTNRNST